MKKLVVALGATLASVVVPGVPGALANHCGPEPQCCPTAPHCWVKDGYVAQGSGTYSPGLGLVPEPQSMAFSASATVVGMDGILATYPCSFSGTDLAGSIAEGIGALSGRCGPMTFSTCVFVRVAAAFEMACADIGVASGVFTPHNTLPTTSYDLTFAGLGA